MKLVEEDSIPLFGVLQKLRVRDYLDVGGEGRVVDVVAQIVRRGYRCQ
jgi:hypothetical protein